MNAANKRKNTQQDDNKLKRVRKECSFGDECYRKNTEHFREFSHPHLEAILDTYKGIGPYNIPEKYTRRVVIEQQLDVIVEKQLYTPWIKDEASVNTVGSERPHGNRNGGDGGLSTPSTSQPSRLEENTAHNTSKIPNSRIINPLKGILKKSKFDPEWSEDSSSPEGSPKATTSDNRSNKSPIDQEDTKEPLNPHRVGQSPYGEGSSSTSTVDGQNSSSQEASKRRAEDYITVVLPKGRMSTKHAASAPYHIFYTTITAAKETHNQPYSITFQEILDRSLGELKCSLQINSLVDLGWLRAQYYFAGYRKKELTILYGEDMHSPDLQTINQKSSRVSAHRVRMESPYGVHHTKMMILCYEDGSLRVVITSANLYDDNWENKVQGLWFSPRCPELPPTAMPYDGDSPTMFKRSLLRFLNEYDMPALTNYIERVKRCDFSHINVFLVASVPDSQINQDWGLIRMGTLLRQHCSIPPAESRHWPLLVQANCLDSFGKDPSVWLTGDFLHHFSKIMDQPHDLRLLPALKLIYPSLENVQDSHDGLNGGGSFNYSASVHTKQPWLNDYLYQWRAKSTARDRAVPHVKTYARVSPGASRAAYFLLTSANCTKAAWGINKGLKTTSYEAGVLFLPKFVINEDFFPLRENAKNRLVLPYDVPPLKYTSDMSPWVADYLEE